MAKIDLPKDEIDGAESELDLVEIDDPGDIDEMSHSTEKTEE